MNFSITDIKELTLSMLGYPNMDYTNYSLSFLKRRLAIVFTSLNLRRKDQFIEMLKKKDFRDQVITRMLVDNTEMFRDPAFWRMLRDKIVNDLPSNSSIWFPCESSGEEVYSLSVILHEQNLSSRFKLFCSNPSIEKCNAINHGRLNGKDFDINFTNYRRLEENEFFDSYFTLQNGHLIVCEKLRENVNCVQGGVSDTIPSGIVSLILFRNVSIYYNHRQAISVFDILYEKLMPGGYLVIGVKEQLPEKIGEKMIVIDETEKIYKKPLPRTNGLY